MFGRKVKMIFVTALTALFLFSISSCSMIGIKAEKNDTNEFLISQVSRGLGYKISDRKPNSICKVKEVSECFLNATEKEEFSDEQINDFADIALNYLSDQINHEDEILAMGFKDLIKFVKIDLEDVKIDEDNLYLVRIAVKAYLEGLGIVADGRNIQCE